MLNRSDLRIFEIDLVIFLNELGIFENELRIFVNEWHLSIKCSITTNEKIKDPCYRGNKNLSLVEGNIYRYNSDLGIFINELRIFEIYL